MPLKLSTDALKCSLVRVILSNNQFPKLDKAIRYVTKLFEPVSIFSFSTSYRKTSLSINLELESVIHNQLPDT